MSVWVAVLALAAGTYALRLAGPLLAQRLTVPVRVQRMLGLAATAMLAALVTTAALTDGSGFGGWARAAGVAVGAMAAWRRSPFVVVVVLAAVTAAALRALGVE
ncbi:MAG: AzlD domain-containing protein [Pseudonocardiaceae bacterium]|nr:AzlD domain-containing protein [Pseudonocardiaceae bacterium]